MTSQPSEQTATIYILPNISQSKVNQTMKFGQLIKYNKKNIFLQNHAENEAETLVPDLFLFFEKVLYEVLNSLNMFLDIVLNLAYIKNKLYKVLNY